MPWKVIHCNGHLHGPRGREGPLVPFAADARARGEQQQHSGVEQANGHVGVAGSMPEKAPRAGLGKRNACAGLQGFKVGFMACLRALLGAG